MKVIQFLMLPALFLAAGLSHAQSPAEQPAAGPLVEPVPPAAPRVPPPGPPATPAKPLPTIPAATNGATPATGAPPVAADAPKNQMEASDEGYLIKDAPINDIFQFLAKAAGRQYFHNAKIASPEFRVTGHLNDGNPLQQMEELAFMYGLALHTKGSTIYALTQAQLAQLPSAEFHYQLQYLRPTDIKTIEDLIKPMLSPATGIVNFEPKTNTIIIIDAAHRIEQARALLRAIDRAKGQIIVETKILRINTTVAERTGVNWSNSLGTNGTTVNLGADLNAIFGLNSPLVTTANKIITNGASSSRVITDVIGTGASSSLTGGTSTSTTTVGGGSNTTTRDSISTAGPNLVLSRFQLTGVLRALAEGGLATQISNPTLITEDNEMATISVIDRVPIITTTSTAASGGSAANPTVTEQVRYKIDTSDKSIDADPNQHREIGISLVVTPTLLPDGTVRMKLRPRSAQIVESIKSVTGNFYPRVTESMIETLARVPNGFSLVVGGFYGETKTNGKTKVPVLGDIPVINFFFKSKEATKEKTSLVFIVTPKSYDPTSSLANANASKFVRRGNTIGHDYDWLDESNPGPTPEPNLRRAIRGLKPQPAPYYPLPGEDTCNPPPPQEPASSAQPGAKSHLTKARRE